MVEREENTHRWFYVKPMTYNFESFDEIPTIRVKLVVSHVHGFQNQTLKFGKRKLEI
jgi:hypothetical protein